jgi:hypothetical protein
MARQSREELRTPNAEDGDGLNAAAAAAVLLPADIPACLWHQCKVGDASGQATCHDRPAPALNNTAGRSCDCAAPGYFYTEGQGCQGELGFRVQ